MNRRLLRAMCLSAVSLLALVACSSSDATSLQSELKAELRPGMSVEEIHSVLRDHAIEYSAELHPASKYSDLDGEVPPDTLVIGAGKHFPNDDFLEVTIVLDDELRFERLISKVKKPVL